MTAPVPAILVLSDGFETALRIHAGIGGEILARDAHLGADRGFENVGETLRGLFGEGRPLVGLFAAGILIRCLAPVLADKRAEPPVLAVAPDGSAVVPLLGGLTGAEPLARRIAEALGVAPASTASRAVAQQPDTPLKPSTLAVVGLGPGDPSWLTREARQALAAATDVVGYGTYLDLLPPLRPDQRRHASDNRMELARARQALALAAEGRTVALVSSGDPGIFAMAAAVMEAAEVEPFGVDIRVVPGVSAMQAAAARVGAPLGHDFAVLSLSDIRKPWAVIEKRLRLAGEADLVLALYNPASSGRRTQLARAKTILGEYRPADTPVVVARNVGRPGEQVSILSLAALRPEAVDMRTLLIVGSTQTRRFTAPDGRVFVYTPRSYDAGQEYCADSA